MDGKKNKRYLYNIIVTTTILWRPSRPGFLSFSTHNFVHKTVIKKKSTVTNIFANMKNRKFANNTIYLKEKDNCIYDCFIYYIPSSIYMLITVYTYILKIVIMLYVYTRIMLCNLWKTILYNILNIYNWIMYFDIIYYAVFLHSYVRVYCIIL